MHLYLVGVNLSKSGVGEQRYNELYNAFWNVAFSDVLGQFVRSGIDAAYYGYSSLETAQAVRQALISRALAELDTTMEEIEAGIRGIIVCKIADASGP